MYKIALELLSKNQVNLPHTSAGSDTWNRILIVLYTTVGAIGLLLLLIAGLRYTLAGGDANKISEAKRMIAYTLVGIVVISLAGAIVKGIISL